MSKVIDSDLPEGLAGEWLSAIEGFLPAFLAPSSEEEPQEIEDLSRLLNLDDGDLKQVLAVHLCLDERIIRFGARLRHGLRQPMIDTDRPPETSQAVRGGVDWGRTMRLRTQTGMASTSFVVRSSIRIYDTPENRSLAWLLRQLRAAIDRTGVVEQRGPEDSEGDGGSSIPPGWRGKIAALDAEIRVAERTQWLESVRPERPTRESIKSLRASRNSFFAVDVVGAIQSLFEFGSTDDRKSAVEALRQRYFKPARAWRLFEVYVALKLFDGFANSEATVKRLRKIEGIGRQPYAEFELQGGDVVKLYSQGWPSWLDSLSRRREVADRHDLAEVSSQQDLFIERSVPGSMGLPTDCVVLELKASLRAGTLSEGLSQLLGYLGDFEVLQQFKPAGWLVAPKSDAFSDVAPDPEALLWMVSVDQVAEAAVARFRSS